MRPLAASLPALALTLAGAACTDDGTEPKPEPQPKLEIGMQATIPAGAEVEYCQFVTVPETWVTKDKVEFTAGSHHVLVYQTPYTSIPTQKTDGTKVDTSGVFDCSDGPTNGWEVTKLVGGSQNRNGDAFLSFPEGVGVRLGGVMLINVHYRNGSDAPLATDVKVVFDTMAAEDVVQEGDILFLFNPLISVPPGRTARSHWRCPVYQDITIANVQSHMHARGVGYQARLDSGEPFYASDRWEDVPVKAFEGFTVKAGSKLDYYCDFRNTSGTPVYMGPRTTDEMCMLIGSYYPADPRTANCLGEQGELGGGEWIGQGTATCQQTMGCIQQAQAQGLPAITDCMLAASPAVSRESSDLLRCFMNSKNPLAECGPQVQACAAR
jgi:Copper type II ascorbate-dependent monooxygenase, C-terminal domain